MIAAGIAGPAAGVILTPMTVAMVIAIGFQCKAKLNMRTAIAIMADFVGFILGTSIAMFIIGLAPGIGNLANAIATGFVTQLLGWLTYIILKDDHNAKKAKTFLGKLSLIKEALGMRTKAGVLSKKLKQARQRMTESDRKKYDELMRIITNKETTKSEQERALSEAEQLLERYGTSI